MIAPEEYRTNQNFVYALNTLGEIMIFDVIVPSGGDRNGIGERGGECKLQGRIKFPEDFTTGSTIGVIPLKGAIAA